MNDEELELARAEALIGTISLADATCEADVSWKGRAHSAATDAITTADLVTEIAKVQRDLVVQLQELQSKGNLE